MKKLLSLALAILMLAVMLPVTALADTAAPSWVGDVNFEGAQTVYYYSTYGGAPYVKTATDGELSSHPAVIAYQTGSGNEIAYAADIRAALVNKAIEIYCKAGSTISTVNAHANVLNDVTIYGNNANFQGGDLSIYADGKNYAAPESLNVTINIYNAKNLVVWGEPQAVGRTWNVNFYDCVNDGCNFFMYRGGSDKTDKANLTMINCKATGYADSTVHTTADGSIVIKNCEFSNNCAPVNIAHKQTGTMTASVENCTFNNCGKVNPSDDYFAPVRFVNSGNGSLDATIENNTFTGTVGNNGDILLGDYREGKESHDVTATITPASTGDTTVKNSLGDPKPVTEKVTAKTGGSITPVKEEGPTTIVIISPTQETPKTDDQKNPTTGANDLVGVAAAAAVMALLGAAAVLRKK